MKPSPTAAPASHQLAANAFRLKLVRALALETEYGKRTYQSGVSERLAADLGVTTDMLRDAAEYVRRGFRPEGAVADVDPKGLIEQRYWVASADQAEVRALAAARRMGVRELARSVLHYGMLSTLEPTRVLVTNVRLNGRTRPGHTFTSIFVSKGLLGAVRQRAAGAGMEVATYVRSWLVGYAKGELPDLKIKAVPLLGMYDDAANYVLPACWLPEVEADRDKTA